MKKIKIDWVQAKKEFLLNNQLTLKEIASKYGLSYSKIRKLSSKRGWFGDKKQIWQLIDKALMKETEIVLLEKIHRGEISTP